MVNEDHIRDLLVKNLEVLEPGLRLADSEHLLRNTHGAKGFVDIVAYDKLDTLVLIELKRSNSASRQAVHEILKYVNLIRQNYRLPSERIRCLIVSTTWHELLVPFSELLKSVPFSVTGYHIEVDDEGTVIRSNKVNSASVTPHLTFYYYRPAAFFSTEKEVRDYACSLSKGLQHIGLEDYCTLLLHYSGENESIVFPFAHVLAIAKISQQLRQKIISECRLGFDIDPYPEIGEPAEFNDIAWDVEESIAGNLHIFCGILPEEVSDLPPGKLTEMLEDWKIIDISRYGSSLQSKIAYPDEALIRFLQGVEDDNSWLYDVIVTPQHVARWSSVVEDVTNRLRCAPSLRRGVQAWLAEIEEADSSCTVAISIYYPGDLIFGLVMTWLKRTSRFLPQIRIVAYSNRLQEDRTLHGQLCWDYESEALCVDEMLKEVFGGAPMYAFLRMTDHVREYDSSLLEIHGLRYALFETHQRKSEKTLEEYVRQGRSWHRREAETRTLRSFEAFFRENDEYLEQLSKSYQQMFVQL